MALKDFETIKDSEVSDKRIHQLRVRPNQRSIHGDPGLTGKELQEKYDAYAELLRQRFNVLVEAIKESLDNSDENGSQIAEEIMVVVEKFSSTDSRTDNLAHAIEVMIERILDSEKNAESASASAEIAIDIASGASAVAGNASADASKAVEDSNTAKEKAEKAHETVSFLLSKIAGIATDGGGFVYGDFENNVADGEFAEAHGKNTKAKAPFATAFGQDTSVYSARGFAGGFNVQLEGEAENTFAWGTGLRSNTRDQILLGRYNVKDPEAVLIIGDGSDDKNRSNAVVIKKDGRIIHKVTESSLLGKKISFTGDSICAGLVDPSIGEKYNYAMLLQEKYGMNVLANIAQGGGTICKTTRYGGSVENFCIAESVNLLPEDSDYVILSGGVNDAAHMVDYDITLGSVQTSYTFPPTVSVGKNFAKAFEKMLYDANVRFAGKKIGFISVHQMSNRYSVMRPEEDNFYLIAKKCCEKWGVPFLDLTASVPPYGLMYPRIVENESDLEKVGKYFVDDGWHPTRLGYETLYLLKVVSWLESL